MSYSEILETSEDERYHVRLVLDECPPEPYDCSQSPLLRIGTRGGGHRAEHIHIGDRPTDADDQIENAIHHWATCPADSDWTLFEKYLRAFHGVTQIETWHSGSYWYVTYDSAAWREWCGAPAGGADMSEWRAYCEGDVWGWIVEKNVTWHADDDRDDMSTWEDGESCWGYYGSDGANGKYLKSCAREALLDAQISDHGGVFGPLPENQPEIWNRLEHLRGELRAERISQGELCELAGLARYIEAGDTELLEAAGVPEHTESEAADWPIPPERIAAAVEDMERVQRNLDADREAGR
jgi:hypothetical protein